MSILIKGMEMPKEPFDGMRLLIASNGCVYVDGKYQSNVEAVELPPHGEPNTRMIDAEGYYAMSMIDFINRTAMSMIDEMTFELYDFTDDSESMENLRIATLGEIRGICQLAKALKNGMLGDFVPTENELKDVQQSGEK